MSISAAAGQANRLFPRVTESFYSDRPAQASLALSARLLDAYRRSDRSGQAVFNRLMAAHCEEFAAEIAGIWDKSDYYREECLDALRSCGDAAECWSSGARALGFGVEGPEFRRRFAREVVMDSHAGFFLGQIKAGLKPLERPFVHFKTLARVQQDMQLLTEDEERELVDPMVAAGLPLESADFLIEAARLFPRQKIYAILAMNQINTRVSKELQVADSSPKRLEITRRAIAVAEKLRAAAPWCADCYRFIGVMYHERAILLANQQELRTSLESIAKSATYAGPQVVSGSREQLNQILAALRARVAQIRQEMLLKPGAQLTSQGNRLVSLADNATKDAEKWERSAEATQISQLRDEADTAQPRELAQPPEAALPLVHTKATQKVRGEETFADWLASRRGRWVRWQMAAAAVLVLATACLAGWQAFAGYSMNAARGRAEKIAASGNDAAALDALSDFFAAPRPLRFDPNSDAGLAEIYRSTLARWAASRAMAGGQVSDADRRRIRRYKGLVQNSSRFPAGLMQEVKQ